MNGMSERKLARSPGSVDAIHRRRALSPRQPEKDTTGACFIYERDLDLYSTPVACPATGTISDPREHSFLCSIFSYSTGLAVCSPMVGPQSKIVIIRHSMTSWRVMIGQ